MSFRSAKYAMNRLSGDQNGNAAPWVPGRGCAVSESMGRVHNRVVPDGSRAVNASLLPSGEMATLVPTRLNVTNVVFSGGYTKNRVVVSVAGRVTIHQPVVAAIVVSANTAAAVCQTAADRSLLVRTTAPASLVGALGAMTADRLMRNRTADMSGTRALRSFSRQS